MSGDEFTLENITEYGGFEGEYHTIEETVEGSYEDLELKRAEDGEKIGKKLKNYVWDSDEKIFFFDYHSNALAPWIAACNSGLLGEDSVLLHIDQHQDGSKPSSYDPENCPRPSSLTEAYNYISKTRVTEFVKPVDHWGIFFKIKNWGVRKITGFPQKDERGLPDVRRLESKIDYCRKFAMDIDLDVFKGMEQVIYAEERPDELVELPPDIKDWAERNDINYSSLLKIQGPLDVGVDFERFYRAIAEGIEKAELTTISTSPWMINQEEALEHIKNIFQYY